MHVRLLVPSPYTYELLVTRFFHVLANLYVPDAHGKYFCTFTLYLLFRSKTVSTVIIVILAAAIVF